MGVREGMPVLTELVFGVVFEVVLAPEPKAAPVGNFEPAAGNGVRGLLSLFALLTAAPAALNLFSEGVGDLILLGADSLLAPLRLRLCKAADVTLLLGTAVREVVVPVIFLRPAMGSLSGDGEALGMAPLVLVGVELGVGEAMFDLMGFDPALELVSVVDILA